MNEGLTQSEGGTIRLLGPISILARDGNEHAQGPLAANLLLSLALAPGRSQSTESLIADIWEQYGDTDKRPALQTLVSRLRSLAGAAIIATTAGGYTLSESNDLTHMGALANRAKSAAAAGDHDTVMANCDDAMALVQGRIGAGASNDELVEELTASVENHLGQLRHLRSVAGIALGRPAEVLADLRQLSARSPYDDTVMELVLRALHQSGRTNEALDSYAEYRARLAEDLGSRPTQQLDAYHSALLQENNSPQSGPKPASNAATVHLPDPQIQRIEPMRLGLRTPPNQLIGREDDLARLTHRLGKSRLVTIQGPGGIGKTRLARELANRASARGIDVAVVEFSGLRPDADIGTAIASILGIRETATSTRTSHDAITSEVLARLIDMLDDRPTLLVIDNCEHVLDGVAQWVDEVLAATTGLRILATSRAPLSIAAERIYLVEPLPSIDMEGELGAAAKLFITRAHAARPGTALPRDAVIRLCRKLDGLPLAIELAAARTRVMSVEEIEHRLTDRFALLVSGDRTAPKRHQTIAAVIEWSWDLLSARQCKLGRALCVFPDGFSADAATSVAAGFSTTEVIDDLEALVAQSLLRADNDVDGHTRFRMLETVREYAIQQQAEYGETRQVQEAMLNWASEFAKRIALEMDGDDQEIAFAKARSELENVSAAMRLAADLGDPQSLIACYAMIGSWWVTRSAFGELFTFTDLMISSCANYIPEPENAQFAVLAFSLTELMLFRIGTMREIALAHRGIRRALQIADPLNSSYRLVGEIALQLASQEKMIAIARRGVAGPTTKATAVSLLLLSSILENSGRIDEAIDHAERAREAATAVNHLWSRAMAAQVISGLYSQTHRSEIALHWALLANKDFLKLGARIPNGEIEQLLAFIYLAAEDYDAARKSFHALSMLGERGAPELVMVAEVGLAEVDRMTGNIGLGLEKYRELAARSSYRVDSAMRPWVMIIDAAMIAVHVLEGQGDRPEVNAAVGELAREILAWNTISRNAVDFPVIGSTLVGLSAWELHCGNPSGVELLALAERFSSRQDFPALVRDHHWALLARMREEGLGQELPSPAAARAHLAGLDLAESLARAFDLVAQIAGS